MSTFKSETFVITMTIIFWIAVFLFQLNRSKERTYWVGGSDIGTWLVFIFIVLPIAFVVILHAFLLPGVIVGVLTGVLLVDPQNIYNVYFAEGIWPWTWQILLIIDVVFWAIVYFVIRSLK